MLILTRKPGQDVAIDGGRIKITVVRIRGNEVKLGIEAQRDTAINRGEVQAIIDQRKEGFGDGE